MKVSESKTESNKTNMVQTNVQNNDKTMENSVVANIEMHIDQLFSYSDHDDNNDYNDDHDDHNTMKNHFLAHYHSFDSSINDQNIKNDKKIINFNYFTNNKQNNQQISKNDTEEDAFLSEENVDSLENSDSKSSLSTRSGCSLLVPFEFRAILADSPDRGVAIISNFGSMKTLYHRIAKEFDISPDDILYCTLNTPMADMERVLGGQIGLDDIIFVHRSSLERKEIEIRKTENCLGLTIADNGNGRAFIKHIHPHSTASRVPFIQPGDHIEAIQGKCFIGSKHSEVANALRSIELNEVFIITLIEPRRGQLSVEKQSPTNYHENHNLDKQKEIKALERIAGQLEHFIGVNDCQLARELYDAANDRSPKEFASIIATGPLHEFCFPAHVLAIVWNSVNFPP